MKPTGHVRTSGLALVLMAGFAAWATAAGPQAKTMPKLDFEALAMI